MIEEYNLEVRYHTSDIEDKITSTNKYMKKYEEYTREEALNKLNDITNKYSKDEFHNELNIGYFPRYDERFYNSFYYDDKGDNDIVMVYFIIYGHSFSYKEYEFENIMCAKDLNRKLSDNKKTSKKIKL